MATFPAVTGPKPFGIDITDPMAFLVQEYEAAVEKVVSLLGPSAPEAASILSASVQAAYVIALVRDPINGKNVTRLNEIMTAFKAQDLAGLAAYYNRIPLEPDETRDFCRACMLLAGFPSSAFPA